MFHSHQRTHACYPFDKDSSIQVKGNIRVPRDTKRTLALYADDNLARSASSQASQDLSTKGEPRTG